MSRSTLALVCVCLFAAPVRSEQAPVTIAYDPGSQVVRVDLPAEGGYAIAADRLPDWLVLSESGRSVAGTLPAPGESRLVGAQAEGAFWIDALRWLERPAGAMPPDLVLSLPDSHRGAATLSLEDDSTTEGRYTARFAATDAAPEINLFFGPYEIGTRPQRLDNGRAVTVRTYFKPSEVAFADDYLDAAGGYLQRFDRQIGPYPGEDFAVVSAPIPVGYAFPGLTYVSDRILGHPYMLGRSLAHEVLHNWWGSGVRVDYDAGNWAEGLTTYQADHALAAEAGGGADRAMRRDWLVALSARPADDTRRIRDFVSAGHARDQSVGYGKTAMVFHMLRTQLGADAFDAGLRRFWTDHAGAVADWSDLQAAFEAASGSALDVFFAQWLDRPGLPDLRLAEASVTQDDKGHVVTLALSQEGAPFALRIPVTIETAVGPVTQEVRLDGVSVRAEIRVPARPTALSVDPGFDVLRRLREGELPATLRDVMRAEGVAVLAGDGAEDAARQLAERLLGTEDREIAALGTGSAAGAFVAVGATAEIAAFRDRRIAGTAPAQSRAGDVRAWVETDAQGRPWLFVSADRPARIPDALSALRYFGNQSYVVAPETGRPTSGRWPVTDSPLRVVFDG